MKWPQERKDVWAELLALGQERGQEVRIFFQRLYNTSLLRSINVSDASQICSSVAYWKHLTETREGWVFQWGFSEVWPWNITTCRMTAGLEGTCSSTEQSSGLHVDLQCGEPPRPMSFFSVQGLGTHWKYTYYVGTITLNLLWDWQKYSGSSELLQSLRINLAAQ